MRLTANKQLLLVAGVCLLVILGVQIGLKTRSVSPDEDIQPINIGHCDFSAPCYVGFDNHKITITINKPVVLLKPFIVEISLRRATGIHPVAAGFSMRNMDMGVNRFVFGKKTQNRWQAEALLPVCTRGRSDWLMEISMEADNNRRYKLLFPVTARPR